MTTAKDVFEGVPLPAPVYEQEPYIVLGKENVVLAAGDVEYIKSLHTKYAGYYDDCRVEVRQNDLYQTDNTRVNRTADGPMGEIAYLTPSQAVLVAFQSLCEQYPSENTMALWEMAGCKAIPLGEIAAALRYAVDRIEYDRPDIFIEDETRLNWEANLAKLKQARALAESLLTQ